MTRFYGRPVRFYGRPVRFWCKSPPHGNLHTILVLAWDLATDTFRIEDTCCGKTIEVTQEVLAKGTAAPWNCASVLEAEEWLEARVSLGLANTYTF